jgi:hypothetical protein
LSQAIASPHAVDPAESPLTPESWGKLGMWIFLAADAMSFGGLLAGYGALRAGATDWPNLGVRSEHVTVGVNGGTPGTVQLIEPLGAESLVFFEYGGATPLVAKIDPETTLDTGDKLHFEFDPTGFHLFDAASGARLN